MAKAILYIVGKLDMEFNMAVRQILTKSPNLSLYGKIFEGENFHSFRNFLLNRECFTLNSLLAIDIHYQKELLPRKFSCEHSFSILTAKVFLLEYFAIYVC